MHTPLYLLVELSLFFIGINRYQQLFQDADAFFSDQKKARIQERRTLQLAGMYAIRINLDQARLFFCELEPYRCKMLSQKHASWIEPLRIEIAEKEATPRPSPIYNQ